MPKYKIGDKVQYDGREYTIADWDDILEEHVLQGAEESDRVSIAEELIQELSGGPGTNDVRGSNNIAAKVRAQPKRVMKAEDPNISLGGPHGIRPQTSKNTNTVAHHSQDTPVDNHHQRTADPAANTHTAKKSSHLADVLAGKKMGGIQKAQQELKDKKAASQARKRAMPRQDTKPELAKRIEARRNAAHKAKMADLLHKTGKRVKGRIREGNEGMPDLENDQAILDETAAGDTIKAKSSDASGVMKTSMVADVIKHMAGMTSSDQVDFYNKMMTQYGKGKSHGAPEKAGANKASINAKKSDAKSFKVDSTSQLPSVQIAKEDLEAILNSEEDLSEEFKLKAATLFEAAVNLKVAEKMAEIEEQVEAQLEEELDEAVGFMVEKVDAYLSYFAEEWADDNAVAIESNLKAELSESLIDSLKNVFAEHYINVPEDKVDIVEALAAENEELEEELNKQLKTNVELVETLEEYDAEQIFDEISEGLAMTQVEKFRALSEGLDYNGDADEYRSKLQIVREEYFDKAPRSNSQQTLTEEYEGDYEEDEVIEESSVDGPLADPSMQAFVNAISRTTRK